VWQVSEGSAVPVLLFNGESIVDIMIEKGLGVERQPLYAYYERPGDFSDIEEE
jgi:restriction system protein